MCVEEAEGATNIWYVTPVVYHRALRCTKNIGASRFGMYGCTRCLLNNRT